MDGSNDRSDAFGGGLDGDVSDPVEFHESAVRQALVERERGVSQVLGAAFARQEERGNAHVVTRWRFGGFDGAVLADDGLDAVEDHVLGPEGEIPGFGDAATFR